MSVDDHTLPEKRDDPAPLVLASRAGWRPGRRHPPGDHPRRPRTRVRKLRLLAVVAAFAVLAVISAVFGMLMSVAADLPQLENKAQFSATVDSYLYDDTGRPIGVLAPPTNQHVLDDRYQISSNMVHAIVAVEDKRFWTDPGVDLRGLVRAAVADLTGSSLQGGSTIAEQFVKNVQEAENNRTILEKLREAGLAFQLVHRWSKWKILTSYLNTIYFGNGAYGIESAARVYFGKRLGYDPANPAGTARKGCGDSDVEDKTRKRCAQLLNPAQAALLAGMVANPSQFDPVMHPQAAKARRDLVLQDMLAQHYITRAEYGRNVDRPLPTRSNLQQPQEPAAAPYFTSWVRPQIVHALEREGVPRNVAQYQAYYGGLKIKLTVNLQLQQDAQRVIDAEFPPGSGGPTASLVAIDNSTGEVRAMVSGDGDYRQSPFNLATLGYRQPGSAFKLFTLVAAVESGDYGPDSVITSEPLSIPYRLSGRLDHFNVRNFGNTYSGPETLAEATAISDNSVFAQVGMHIGTQKIRQVARSMGIRSPISTTPAMILGGLNTGVSALDMAHAYETLATGGLKVTNPALGDIQGGPIGIHSISGCKECDQPQVVNHPTLRRVMPETVAATVHDLLLGPVSPGGTASIAEIPGVEVAGKTGTTSNYADAWFVGWTPKLTVAVWVGYPNSAKPMMTNYNGGPVEGGTYPALIWRDFMLDALPIVDPQASSQTSTTGATALAPPATPPATAAPPTAGSGTAPATTPATTQATAPATSTTPATTGNSGAAVNTTPATTPATTGNSGAAATAPAAPATTPAAPSATSPATPATPAAPPAGTPAPPPSSSGTSGNSGTGGSSAASGGAGLGAG